MLPQPQEPPQPQLLPQPQPQLLPQPQPQRRQPQLFPQPQDVLPLVLSEVPATLPLLCLQEQPVVESVTPETEPVDLQQGLQQEFATKPGNVRPPQRLQAIKDPPQISLESSPRQLMTKVPYLCSFSCINRTSSEKRSLIAP